MSTRRRRLLPWILLIAFVVVPLVEIAVIIQVGQVIGGWWTLLLLIVDSVIGAWLVKREGLRAWRALAEALNSIRMPADELADGALILVGGTLLLTPGFVTDAVGFALVLPVTRPIARRLLRTVLARRLVVVGGPMPGRAGGGDRSAGGRSDSTHPGAGQDGPVIRGDVVDE